MQAAPLVALSFFSLFGYATAAEFPWSVSLKPAEVFQGGVLEVRVSGEEIQTIKGSLREQEIPFFSGQRSFIALLGVDLEEKAGPVEISIQAQGKNGEKSEKRITLRIREKSFPREKITVPASFDRLDEAARRRIEREQELLNRLWALSSLRRWWEGRFLAPVPGEITSPFGLKRIVNGSPRAPHGGVDLKAALGTEIFAANHGQVVLREELFFSGKSIVLDHGGGLYTMYFHLDDFHVEKDAQVRKGELIGWAGKTGRVTGPHLHWGARLNGARVDPLELLEITGAIQ